MFEQTFAFSDIPKVLLLAFLELLLSADNAVILAIVTQRLPESQRKKALFIGVLSAFILRALALLSAAFILRYRWIQMVGAIYLLYIAIRHFWQQRTIKNTPIAHSFWGVVALVELFDLAFAIDSIVAGVAFINSGPVTSAIHPKLWIVYVGAMIGLLCTRVAAGVFSRLLNTFPKLELSAYLLVGWVGIKLGASAYGTPLPASIFWSVTATFFLFAFLRKKPW